MRPVPADRRFRCDRRLPSAAIGRSTGRVVRLRAALPGAIYRRRVCRVQSALRRAAWPPWGIFRDEVNPVARSNVCPEIDPPATPSFYAFSYTVPDGNSTECSFVAAGSGEARDGGPSYQGRIIRRGDQSPEAMREKARFVLGVMEQRMTALGFGWADVTATQVYTIFDIHPLLPDEIVRRGVSPGGLTWHFARPPNRVSISRWMCAPSPMKKASDGLCYPRNPNFRTWAGPKTKLIALSPPV